MIKINKIEPKLFQKTVETQQYEISKLFYNNQSLIDARMNALHVIVNELEDSFFFITENDSDNLRKYFSRKFLDETSDRFFSDERAQ